MVEKLVIIIQSYEEVPFLVAFLKTRIQRQVECEIINFGGNDLLKHISNLGLENISAVSDYSNKFIIKKSRTGFLKLVSTCFFCIKLFFLKYRLARFDRIIFFTPLCAPHLLPVLKNNFIRVVYIPIPILKKKKFVFDDGLIVKPLKLHNLNISTILKLAVFKIFYGREINFVKLGAFHRPGLSNSFLARLAIDNETFSNSKKVFDEVNKHYLSYNYFPKLIQNESKEKKAIFFDQHYEQRGLVDDTKYISMLNNIIEILHLNKFSIFYKGHPGNSTQVLECIPNYVQPLPNFIPAEFIGDEKTLTISATSGAIAYNNGGPVSLSIVKIVPFHDPFFSEKALEVLRLKAIKRIYVPSSILELEEVIKSFDSDTSSKNLKSFNSI